MYVGLNEKKLLNKIIHRFLLTTKIIRGRKILIVFAKKPQQLFPIYVLGTCGNKKKLNKGGFIEVAQQSVTKIRYVTIMNMVTQKAGANCELLFNKPASFCWCATQGAKARKAHRHLCCHCCDHFRRMTAGLISSNDLRT